MNDARVHQAMRDVKKEYTKRVLDKYSFQTKRAQDDYIQANQSKELPQLALKYIRQNGYRGEPVAGIASVMAVLPGTTPPSATGLPKKLPANFNPVLAKMAFYATAESLDDIDSILAYRDPLERLEALYEQLKLFSSLPRPAFSSDRIHDRVQDKRADLMSRKRRIKSDLEHRMSTMKRNSSPRSGGLRFGTRARLGTRLSPRRTTNQPTNNKSPKETPDDKSQRKRQRQSLDTGDIGDVSPKRKRVRLGPRQLPTEFKVRLPSVDPAPSYTGGERASVKESQDDEPAPPPCPPLQPGDQITSEYFKRQYTLVKNVGKGGYGTVWETRDNEGNPWALKIMTVRPHMSTTLKLRTLAEFDLLQEIAEQCDAVVGYEEVWIVEEPDRTCIYLVMDLIRGYDLFHYQKTYAINFETWTILACHLKRAIECLQRLGIAHRDLKLENAMVELDPVTDRIKRVVLVDFGFACKMNQCDGRHGTPFYLPPELLNENAWPTYSENPQTYLRADLWSLGVMLYQLAYGKNPFYPSDWTDMIQRYPHNDPKRVMKPFSGPSLRIPLPQKHKPVIDQIVMDLMYGPQAKDRKEKDVDQEGYSVSKNESTFTFHPEARRFNPEFDNWLSCHS